MYGIAWLPFHTFTFSYLHIFVCFINAILSVDGDLQGLERLHGALTAHMWPGMVLKSGNQIAQSSLPERKEMFEEEESDCEIDYEVLFAGLAGAGEDTEEGWISAVAPTNNTSIEPSESSQASQGRDS